MCIINRQKAPAAAKGIANSIIHDCCDVLRAPLIGKENANQRVCPLIQHMNQVGTERSPGRFDQPGRSGYPLQQPAR